MFVRTDKPKMRRAIVSQIHSIAPATKYQTPPMMPVSAQPDKLMKTTTTLANVRPDKRKTHPEHVFVRTGKSRTAVIHARHARAMKSAWAARIVSHARAKWCQTPEKHHANHVRAV